MAATPPPTSNAIADALEKWADVGPEAEAFVFLKRGFITRDKLHELSGKCAAMLDVLGVKQGDVVCNTLPNSPERLVMDLGIMLVGAVVLDGRVVLDYRQDFHSFLLDTGCNVLLYDTEIDEDVVQHLSKEMYAVKANGHRFYPNLPHLKLVLECHLTVPRSRIRAEKYTNCLTLICSLKGADQEQTTCAHRALMDVINDDFLFPHFVKVPSDAATVVWSGACITDEIPKLVLRSQDQLLRMGKSLNEFLSLKSDDVYYCDYPLGSIWGCIAPYLVYGATRVMTDYSRRPVDDSVECLYEVLRQAGCTAAFLDQSQITSLGELVKYIRDAERDKEQGGLTEGGNKTPTGDDAKTSRIPKLTLRVIGYEFHPVRNLHSLRTVAKVCISVYGRCETGVISWRQIDLPLSNNVGRPARDVHVKIVAAKAGVGEIAVKTDQAFSGYFQDRETDRPDTQDTRMRVCADGWVWTGDIGKISGEGKLEVLCHKKNAIALFSHKIYPGWLERKLSTYPGVRQVMVVPVPSSNRAWNELCVCLVPESWSRITKEELKNFCKSLYYGENGPLLMSVPDHYVIMKKDMPAFPDGQLSRRAMVMAAGHFLHNSENSPNAGLTLP